MSSTRYGEGGRARRTALLPPLPILLLIIAVAWAFFSALPAYAFGLPDWFLRVDLFLAWAAFAYALFSGYRRISRTVTVLLGAIIMFGLFELATAIHSGIAIAGPALSFSLYALPLAVVATILLTPLDTDFRRRIPLFLLALVFIEFPISVVQTLVTDHPDDVSGTFPGLELGAHLNGVLAGVAAIWILGQASSFRATLWAYPPLLLLFLTDTKQAALLLPLAVALAPAPGVRVWLLRLAAPILVGVVTLLAPPVPAVVPDDYGYGSEQIQQSASGESRKSQAVRLIAERLTASPPSALLGLGQGQSVSYVALLSQEEGQTLGRSLGLEASPVVAELPPWDGRGSFWSEYSSAIGMIGDLGLLGTAAFLVGLGAVGLMIWRAPARSRGSALALAVFYLGLGAAYIWWEQPVFGLYIGLFIGLALVDAPETGVVPRTGITASLRGALGRPPEPDPNGVTG